MSGMTKSEINKAFNDVSVSLTQDENIIRASSSLVTVSKLLGDLRAAQLDVSAEIFPVSTKLSFTLDAADDSTLPFSGLIHVAGQQLYFAIASTHRGDACSALIISDMDIRYRDSAKEVPSMRYDLSNTADIKQLQLRLIRVCARSQFVAACDPAGVFEGENTPKAQTIIKRKKTGTSFGDQLS